MNIDHAREFIELARCLNFSEAAKNCNLTQPALSKHILALEKEFGTELLDRSRKGLQLTEAGRVLFENSNIMVEAYDKARTAIESIRSKQPIHIVGNMDDADITALSSMATVLAREDNHVSIFFDRSERNPLDSVLSGTADAFIGYIAPKHAEELGLILKEFIAIPLLAVVSPNHVLAKQKSVSWEDLKSQSFIRFTGGTTDPAWEQIVSICEAHGFSPKTRTVSALSNIEFFSTPLRNDVLIWKKTDKQVGLMIETKRRAGIPLSGTDNCLTSYVAFLPDKEEHLSDLFTATKKARELFDSLKIGE